MTESSNNDDNGNQVSRLQKSLEPMLTQGLAGFLDEATLNLSTGERQNRPFWKTFLIGIGDDLIFYLTLKFSINELRPMLPTRIQNTPSDQYICDYVKEMCNVLSGKCQSHFSQQNFSTGLSLPVLTRAFDEYLEPKSIPTPNQASFSWCACHDHSPFMDLSLKVQTDAENFEKLIITTPTTDDSDNIEFL